jgi:hypothetical protein
MSKASLKALVSDKVWQQCAQRLKKPYVIDVLHKLFDHIIDNLWQRIDDIKTDDGRAISFFSAGREILTINITRNDLRIYIHPPAQAYFDPGLKFNVEKFRFWDASFHKKTGNYRGLSVWISDNKYLPGMKQIIKKIPKRSFQP